MKIWKNRKSPKENPLTIESSLISDRLDQIIERINLAKERSGANQTVEIVAVTKTHPPELIVNAYNAGLQTIGENRIQEAENKFPALPSYLTATKRMIGHLQSNKAGRALKLFDTIDSIDSIKLAGKISNLALNQQRVIPVLLEVNTSNEESKFGFKTHQMEEMLSCCDLPGISVKGLMTIGPLVPEIKEIRRAFITLRNLKERLNTQITATSNILKYLSMGMSGDFEIAIEEGSTMVRLGTALFGVRQPYKTV